MFEKIKKVITSEKNKAINTINEATYDWEKTQVDRQYITLQSKRKQVEKM